MSELFKRIKPEDRDKPDVQAPREAVVPQSEPVVEEEDTPNPGLFKRIKPEDKEKPVIKTPREAIVSQNEPVEGDEEDTPNPGLFKRIQPADREKPVVQQPLKEVVSKDEPLEDDDAPNPGLFKRIQPAERDKPLHKESREVAIPVHEPLDDDEPNPGLFKKITPDDRDQPVVRERSEVPSETPPQEGGAERGGVILPKAAPLRPEFAGKDKCVAKTLQGLEGVLADELTAMGAFGVRPLKRAVEFYADRALLYRACYELRTAVRVLVHIHSFRAYKEEDLYRAIRDGVDWSKYMDVMDTLAIDATVAGAVFKHSQYTAQLAKDAIVDQFRDRFRRRPDVNLTSPTLRITVRVNNTECDLLLDASGDSLHKRGYRRDAVEAPINEVLAAGLIRLSGWDAKSPFADCMCGSGTLPIEAAMMALQIPAQHKRETLLGITKWKDFDTKLWKTIKGEADSKILQSVDFPIYASDMDSRARNATSINIMGAGLEQHIRIERLPFDKTTKPAESGTIIMNPPYDERLQLDDSLPFYQSIADHLKKSWTGWDAWIISAHKEALKHFGLRASRRIELINGSLECSFQKFPLYVGSKKDYFPQVETVESEEDTEAAEGETLAANTPVVKKPLPELPQIGSVLPVFAKIQVESEVSEPIEAIEPVEKKAKKAAVKPAVESEATAPIEAIEPVAKKAKKAAVKTVVEAEATAPIEAVEPVVKKAKKAAVKTVVEAEATAPIEAVEPVVKKAKKAAVKTVVEAEVSEPIEAIEPIVKKAKKVAAKPVVESEATTPVKAIEPVAKKAKKRRSKR